MATQWYMIMKRTSNKEYKEVSKKPYSNLKTAITNAKKMTSPRNKNLYIFKWVREVVY